MIWDQSSIGVEDLVHNDLMCSSRCVFSSGMSNTGKCMINFA